MRVRPRFAAAALGIGVATVAAVGLPAPVLALLLYEASGGTIDGILDGVVFDDATWRLQAHADPADVSFTSFNPGPGLFSLWTVPVTPQVSIFSSLGELQAQLLPNTSINRSWTVLSGTFPVGPTPKIGFVFSTPDFFSETAAGLFGVPGLFIDLKSPVALNGPSIFEPFTYTTNKGDLVITAADVQPGTFRITAAPGPLPILAVGGSLLWSRRLRRRIAMARGGSRLM